MSRIYLFLLVGMFALSCSQSKSNLEKEALDSAKKAQAKFIEPTKVQLIKLNDTTVNGIHLKFRLLNQSKYDSLQKLEIKTSIPVEDAGQYIRKIGNYQLVLLKNGSIDSLCDSHDEKSGYKSTYTIKGFWRDRNQLLVNFQDWESYDDYFISLNDGFEYYLNTAYELSPNKNLIIGYTNYNLIPLYGNSFMLSGLTENSIVKYFNFDFGQVAIRNLQWVGEKQCIFSIGELSNESGAFELRGEQLYLLNLN
jgi:hypothetical protein